MSDRSQAENHSTISDASRSRKLHHRLPVGGTRTARNLVLFVIAWLVAVYLFNSIDQHDKPITGLIVAGASFAVNYYARHRAANAAQLTLGFRLWLLLPTVMFILVPAIVRFGWYYGFADSQEHTQFAYDIFRPLLALAVPIFALLWIYLVLLKLERSNSASEEAEEALA